MANNKPLVWHEVAVRWPSFATPDKDQTQWAAPRSGAQRKRLDPGCRDCPPAQACLATPWIAFCGVKLNANSPICASHREHHSFYETAGKAQSPPGGSLPAIHANLPDVHCSGSSPSGERRPIITRYTATINNNGNNYISTGVILSRSLLQR